MAKHPSGGRRGRGVGGPLLGRNEINTEIVDRYGRTLLLWAAQNMQGWIVRRLLPSERRQSQRSWQTWPNSTLGGCLGRERGGREATAGGKRSQSQHSWQVWQESALVSCGKRASRGCEDTAGTWPGQSCNGIYLLFSLLYVLTWRLVFPIWVDSTWYGTWTKLTAHQRSGKTSAITALSHQTYYCGNEIGKVNM